MVRRSPMIYHDIFGYEHLGKGKMPIILLDGRAIIESDFDCLTACLSRKRLGVYVLFSSCIDVCSQAPVLVHAYRFRTLTLAAVNCVGLEGLRTLCIIGEMTPPLNLWRVISSLL